MMNKNKNTNNVGNEDISKYLNIGTTSLNLLGNSINHFNAGQYNPTQFNQFNSVESLHRNAGNTSHLNVEENDTFKDTLSGVTSGAIAGASFGWLGAGVGAVVGGISQLLTSTLGNDKKREEERERFQDHLLGIESQAINIKDKDYYNDVYYGNYYKEGGSMDINQEIFNESFMKYSGLKGLLKANKEVNQSNVFAYGGGITSHYDNGVTRINKGGTHEENKYGGVPISIGQNGLPNLVEEGEILWNGYVFSNKLSPTEDMLDELKLNKKYKNKSYSKIASDISKESEERPYNPISILGLKEGLGKLMIAQELTRAKENLSNSQEQVNLFSKGGDTKSSSPKKDNKSVSNPNQELLEIIHSLENSKGNQLTINDYGYAGYYQMGAEALSDLGVFTKEAVEGIKKADSASAKNAYLKDINNWKNKEDYNKFFNKDANVAKEYQSYLASKYVEKIEETLQNNLGGEYTNLLNKYSRNNIISSAWLGGAGNFIKMVRGENPNLIQKESAEMYRRLTEGSNNNNNSWNPNSNFGYFGVQNAPDFKANLAGNYVRNPERSIEEKVKLENNPNYSTYDEWREEQRKNGVHDEARLSRASYDEYVTQRKGDYSGTEVQSDPLKDINLKPLNILASAPIIGNAINYISSLGDKAEQVQLNRVEPQRLNDRLDYRPTNSAYLADRVRNQYEASRRNVLNTTGGNRGLVQYITMQNDKNMSESLNEAFLKSEDFNNNKMLQAKDYNNKISQFNAQSDIQAQQINANLDMQEKNQNAMNRAGLRSYQNQALNSVLGDVSGLARQLRWEALAPVIYGYKANGTKDRKSGDNN